jgi:hypothetical protein
MPDRHDKRDRSDRRDRSERKDKSDKREKHHSHECRESNRHDDQQDANNHTDVDQYEYQGLVVRNSHTVQVTQTEVQGLLLIQAALQAAVEASIIVLGNNSKNDIQQLQKIAQSLDINQVQKQSVYIEDSGEITVAQTEIQVDAVVQAAINLLAKLLVKVW